MLLVAIMAVFQLWGLGTFDWLVATTLGRRVLSSLLSFALTLLLAVAIWEAVNASFERRLARLTEQAQAARSGEAAHAAAAAAHDPLLITIVIVAGMMVLSEIGVNIGPLLAGAGIVGVAIGFGSQTLVHGPDHRHLPVAGECDAGGRHGDRLGADRRWRRCRPHHPAARRRRFRASHPVQFGHHGDQRVNRGLGNASVSVSVAAHEDTDRVCEVLKEIATGMRAEQDFSIRMLSDLQLWGVEQLDGASATVAGHTRIQAVGACSASSTGA